MIRRRSSRQSLGNVAERAKKKKKKKNTDGKSSWCCQTPEGDHVLDGSKTTNDNDNDFTSRKYDLLQLARQHANLEEEQFLQAIFSSDWNTAAGPTERPIKAKRVAADAGVPCGVFIQDAFNKAERKTMEKTGKSPGELGFKPLADRKKGETVYLKVFPAQLYTDYLLAALANYDERDMASCQRTNRETLVWLARFRLYSWYTVQGAKPWNQEVTHYNIPEELVFELMRPLRTTQQIFGSALSTNSGDEFVDLAGHRRPDEGVFQVICCCHRCAECCSMEILMNELWCNGRFVNVSQAKNSLSACSIPSRILSFLLEI